MKRCAIHEDFKEQKPQLDNFINNFDTLGQPFGNQDRNSLKLFDLNGLSINIKSFRVPNLINKLAYRFFRKSKAQRSFEYAKILINKGIGTPTPIAIYEFGTWLLFKKSYYISVQQQCDLTYRELTTDFSIKDHEAILRAFTRFTHKLHVNGVHFLDHSPGNTLIKRTEGGYKFFLVDLNRMEFGEIDFETRIKNFSKLTVHKSMVETMSNEYAKCTGEDETKVFEAMWGHTKAFQEKYYRKIRIKKRVFFWKKKYRERVDKSPI